jgi:hypothetical protein
MAKPRPASDAKRVSWTADMSAAADRMLAKGHSFERTAERVGVSVACILRHYARLYVVEVLGNRSTSRAVTANPFSADQVSRPLSDVEAARG